MGSPNILSRTQLVCSKQLFYSQSILGNTTVNTTSGYEYITFLLQPFKFSFVQRSNKLPVEQYVKCGRILVLNMCSLAFSGVKFFIVRRTPIFWLALTLRTLRCLNILHMNYFIYTSHHFTPHGRYELNKLASLPMCGFIHVALLVEHRTGIDYRQVTGSTPVEALIFSGFFVPIA